MVSLIREKPSMSVNITVISRRRPPTPAVSGERMIWCTRFFDT
jgi:hypothetical protein